MNMQSIIEESSLFRVNSQHFSARDFLLFVESLETLARLERERKLKREERKEKLRQKMAAVTALKEPKINIEDKIVPMEQITMEPALKEDDENYFSQDNGSTGPVNSKPTSDSEDSGIDAVDKSPEIVVPHRPRSVVMTRSKKTTNSLRSRILGFMSKREDKEHDKFKAFTLRKSKLTKCPAPQINATEDARFLNRAMRYLTL